MSLEKTPLDALHRDLGARMVPFAGYDMPVQYSEGIIAEHRHTREAAGLFDVSHMGQFVLDGPGIAQTLEALLPADLQGLEKHTQTYSLLTFEDGGVRDDLIVTRWEDDQFFLVVNAACKDADQAWIESKLSAGQSLAVLEDRALLALQGPQSREVLAGLFPGAESLTFMQGMRAEYDQVEVYVTCSGYTGEDGYEISLPAAVSEGLARQLLSDERVKPIGLGARDSLRLEAGLCLYGHELAPDITPIESKLQWAIAKARRPGGERAGGYPGAERIAQQMQDGVERVRVGLAVQGKRPVREGQIIIDEQGREIGRVSSGGFGPTLDAPVAMGFLQKDYAELGRELSAKVGSKKLSVVVSKTPFVPQRYFRG